MMTSPAIGKSTKCVYPFVSDNRIQQMEFFRKSQSLSYKNGFASVSLMPPSHSAHQMTDVETVRRNATEAIVSNIYARSSNADLRNDNSDVSNQSSETTFTRRGHLGTPRTKLFQPYYAILDNKALKFDAYFVELLPDSLTEVHRIRAVNIYYHLVDDSISITEPAIDQTGLKFAQGRVFWHQKIPRQDATCSERFWHWSDLNLGVSVEFYGRMYRLVDNDSWTKEFYESSGTTLNSAEAIPPDPFAYNSRTRQQNNQRKYSSHNRSFRTAAGVGFKGERNVCFYAQWTDRESRRKPWRRYFKIKFFLEDNSIEVAELSDIDDDIIRIMLKRQQVPKPGALHSKTIVHEASTDDIYMESDLGVGKWIFVYSRPMLIYACADKRTFKHYKEKFNRDYSEPLSPETLQEISDPDTEDSCSSTDDTVVCQKLMFSAVLNDSRYSCNDLVFVIDSAEPSLLIYEKRQSVDADTLRNSQISLDLAASENPFLCGRLFLGLIKLPSSCCNMSSEGRKTVDFCFKQLAPGNSLRLFCWEFTIREADAAAKDWIQSLHLDADFHGESNQSTGYVDRMLEKIFAKLKTNAPAQA